jgi:alpha-mannosidase
MNPLPQLILDRARQATRRVESRIWSAPLPLPVLAGPVTDAPVDLKAARRQAFKAIEPGTFFRASEGAWGGRWFRVKAPAARPGERGQRFLKWNCDGEATVWIEGAAWAGLDPAHRVCPLPDRAGELWIRVGIWQTGIWVPGASALSPRGCCFDGAGVCVRNEAAWNLFFDLACLMDLVENLLKQDEAIPANPDFGYRPALEDVSPLLRRLLGALEAALEAFRDEDIAALGKAIRAVYRTFPAEAWQPAAELVGHGHLDLVWLWPEAVTEAKGVHTAATMLRLMDRYPEFVFTQTQPALYRALERRAPELYHRIKAHIRKGQWEAQGAFEVEPDNQLPCGEALVRSLLAGQGKFVELTGKPARTCWIPDVFGYSACLPQILAQSGVTRFYTTKLTWSAVTRFPYTSFVWRGHDGSEILTHLCATGYNGDARYADLARPMRQHFNVDVHPAMLLPTGFGDGGGGTTPEQIERSRRFADMAGVPRTRWTSVDAFFDRLERRREALPVYQGELYLEYHRGTYTTQSRFKAAYRALERALQVQEAVRVATGRGGIAACAWQRLAFSQFHDALPGSSIGRVYEELTPELKGHAEAALAAARADLAPARGGDRKSLTVFNPLPMAVDRVVELPGARRRLVSGDGVPLSAQVIGQGRGASTLVRLSLPPLGTVVVKDGGAPGAGVPLTATPSRLANARLEARFDRSGRLSALTIDGTPVPLAAPAWFRLYADHPANFEAWDIDHEALAKHDAPGGTSLRVVECGPVRAVLAGTVTLPKGVGLLHLRYELDAGGLWLRLVAEVEWKADRRLLKWHLPTRHRGRDARFGTPFGSYLRQQQPGTHKEEAQWEVPGSRWAAVLGDDHEGAAIVTEAKYGFSCRDGDLGVSLLRAPCAPDPKADRGHHRMCWAVGLHRRKAVGMDPATAGAADALFTPPLVVPGGKPVASPFAIEEGGSLAPAWVMPEKAGYVIRLHEVEGCAGEARLRFATAPAAVELVDLAGRVVERLPVKGGACRVPYTAYRIVSVKVTREL